MPTKRLFIALLPDDQSLTELSNIVKQIPPFSQIKITPRAQWHLTLCFLGEIEDNLLPKVKELLLSLKANVTITPIIFNVLEYGPLPQNPNLIWLRGKTPLWLSNLWDSLKQNILKNIDLAKIDSQGKKSLLSPTILSHLTLARLKNITLNDLPNLPIFKTLTLSFKSLDLIESILTPKGPIYNTILSIPF